MNSNESTFRLLCLPHEEHLRFIDVETSLRHLSMNIYRLWGLGIQSKRVYRVKATRQAAGSQECKTETNYKKLEYVKGPDR